MYSTGMYGEVIQEHFVACMNEGPRHRPPNLTILTIEISKKVRLIIRDILI